MEQRHKILLLVRSIFIMLMLAAAQQTMAQDKQHIQQQTLRVKFADHFAQRLEKRSMTRNAAGYIQTGDAALDLLNRKWGVTSLKRVFRHAGKFEKKHRKWKLHLWYELTLEENSQLFEALKAFSNFSEVTLAEPVYKKSTGIGGPSLPTAAYEAAALNEAPNDSQLSTQWHYHNTGQNEGSPGADIRLLNAWKMETGRPEVVVAVIDGGVDVAHPDLAANMWLNEKEVADNGIDDDENGYVDDVHGYNFGDDVGSIAASNHGTHVGGTVAAVTNNAVGVAGVAGGSGTGDGVRLMSLATFGASGVGGFDEAFLYAADHGAVISQNSWGYTSPGIYEQSVLDAIDYFVAEAGYDENGNPRGPMQGGIAIFAAGNSGIDGQWYPAYYEAVFAVAASDRNDNPASFSNFGNWVELTAPGVDVYSTYPGGNYGYMSGTSMACPHASGVAALVVSKYAGSITPGQLREKLITSADTLSSLSAAYGAGRLNAYAALLEPDSIAPKAVTDLQITGVLQITASLAWTAPADTGKLKAAQYDLRFSTFPITEENFNDAQIVSLPPPAESGQSESFSVEGLLPNTTYYFALKSRDWGNNLSPLSNVVRATTEDAASISASPTAFELTFDVNEGTLAKRSLSISNLGESVPLTFNLISPEDSVGLAVNAHPATGEVAAGSSAQLELSFDGSQVANGISHTRLGIQSNDPLNPVVYIPVTVEVSGQLPALSVAEHSLNFGTVFLGASKSLPLVIKNIGFDTLQVEAISYTDGAFSVSSDAVTLAPRQQKTIPVFFSPLELPARQASFSIFSNDPRQPELVVSLQGEGAEPPSISINPTEVSSSLIAGQSGTEIIRIANAGKNTLEFSFPKFAAQSLLADPAVAKNSTARVSVPAALRHAPKGSNLTEPQGPAVVLGAGSDLQYGYTWIDSDAAGGPAFIWEDISASGTEILPNADDEYQSIDLPFPFRFYGELKNSLLISSNGFLTFDDNGTAYVNVPIPDSWTPNDYIAPLWDDLMNGYHGRIFYKLDERSLIVQYQAVSSFSGNGTATFQVKIVPNGRIYFYYKDVDGASFRRNATVGIENATGTDGVQVVYNNNYIKDKLALVLMPPDSFITGVSALRGSLEAGSSMDVEVNFSAKPTLHGLFLEDLLVESNDPQNASLAIPFTLDVTGTALLEALPDTLVFDSVVVGRTKAKELIIRNSGTAELRISSMYTSTNHFTLATSSSELALSPGSQARLMVYFKPLETGRQLDTLVIESNQGLEGSPVKIPLSGNGLAPPVFSVSTPGDTIKMKLRSDETGKAKINIENMGGSRLQYEAYVLYGATSGTSALALPAALQPLPLAESKTYETTRAPASVQPTQAAVISHYFSDSITYEAEPTVNQYVGMGAAQTYTIAAKFISPSHGFTLSHIRNAYLSEGKPEGTYVAIMAGGQHPAEAVLVSQQEVKGSLDWGSFRLIELENPVSFAPEQVFWIVFYYKASAYCCPQGFSSSGGLNDTFWHSRDNGSSWLSITADAAIIPTIRALGGETNNWITLDPYSGSLNMQEQTNIQLQANASLLQPGKYQAQIRLSSNDPQTPQLHIPVKVQVNAKPQFLTHDKLLQVKENSELVFRLQANDAEGGDIAYSLKEAPANMIFRSEPDAASIRFKPDYKQSGFYSISVVATDDMQEQVETTFEIEVLDVNRLPVVTNKIGSQELETGASVHFNMADVFEDPDGEPLNLQTSTSNPLLVSLAVNGSTLSLTGLGAGSAVVSIEADDGKGGRVATSFEVKVYGEKKEAGSSKPPTDHDSDTGEGAPDGSSEGIGQDNTAEQALVEIGKPAESKFFADGKQPETFSLQNYPNPFSGTTTIRYSLAEDAHLKLQVLTPKGQIIAVLQDKYHQKGSYKLSFDAHLLPAGLYLYRLHVGEKVMIRQMVVK